MTTYDKETLQEIFGASTFQDQNRRDVKRRVLARCFDEILTPLLWFAFLGAFLSYAIFPSVVGWVCFATFLNFAARVWRESYGTLRDWPYWRSVESERAASRSVATPFWTTSALFLLLLFLRESLPTLLGVASFLFFIDLAFARWTRCFAERTIRAGIELLRSSEFSAEKTRFDDLDETKANPTEKKENLEFYDAETEEEGTIIASQTRTKTTDGEERIAGETLVEFEENAEIAVVNLAFCPPFEGTPTFEYEQVSGPEVVVKTTLIQPFGVRLEVRRRDASEEREPIRLEYFAR